MSGPQPSFSVVITTYNRAELLERAIRSALEQTLPPHEIIVADDGSTDGTRDLVVELSRSDSRIHHKRLASNTGIPGLVRNRACALATGEYLAFLDDDDRWASHHLAALARGLDGDLVCVGANAWRDDDALYFSDRAQVFDHYDVLRANPLVQSSAAVSARAFAAVGGFSERPDEVAVEDLALWLKLTKSGSRGLRLGEPSAYYSGHAGEHLSTGLRSDLRALRCAARFVAAAPTRRSLTAIAGRGWNTAKHAVKAAILTHRPPG